MASSDLRVAFGGLETYNPSQLSATPGGDVVFEELALRESWGWARPLYRRRRQFRPGRTASSFPISRGLVILTNTTDPNAVYGPGPSYLEEFYTTAVHEFGHALGLQHTWTAAAMSQDVIRNTSRATAHRCRRHRVNFGALRGGRLGGKYRLDFGIPSLPTASRGIMASVVAIPPVGTGGKRPDQSRRQLYHQRSDSRPVPAVCASAAAGRGCTPDRITGLALPGGSHGTALQAHHGLFSDGLLSRHHRRDAGREHLRSSAGQAPSPARISPCSRAAESPVYDVVSWAWLDPVSRTYTYMPILATAPLYRRPTPAPTNPTLRMYVEANYLADTIPLPPAPLCWDRAPARRSLIAPYDGLYRPVFPQSGRPGTRAAPPGDDI